MAKKHEPSLNFVKQDIEISPQEKMTEALKLVALVQISSASVERAFSQLKGVMDTVGSTKQPLVDNVELRLFEILNADQYM